MAIVLLEHNDDLDDEEFGISLRTHNTSDLIARIRKSNKVKLAKQHNLLLSLLTKFYKTSRYDRFTFSGQVPSGQEKVSLIEFLSKGLEIELKDTNSFLGLTNESRYKKFLKNVALKVSSEVFGVVKDQATKLNLYTWELREGSRAQLVFEGGFEPKVESIALKEVFIYLMNTKDQSSYLRHLRSIKPLNFDFGLVDEYIQALLGGGTIVNIQDEIETLYEDITDRKYRLNQMEAVGAPYFYFDDKKEDK